MPSHAEFIRNIAQHPADMGPRLVYADWLEERCDVRGEFIQKSIELAEREPKLPRLLKAKSMNIPAPSVSVRDERTGSYRLRTPALHEPMRFEIITEDMPSGIGSLVEVFAGGESPSWIDAIVLDNAANVHPDRNTEYDVRLQMSAFRQQPLPERQEIRELSTRCAALLSEHRREWTMAGLPKQFEFSTDPDNKSPKHIWLIVRGGDWMGFDFARGFPEALTLRFEEWQRHYRTLIDAMPVREVRLTTVPNWNANGIGKYGKIEAWLTDEKFIPLANRHHVIRWEGDPSDQECVLQLLAAEFPGHDREHPIKYTLPQADVASTIWDTPISLHV